jgi:hypothetical protein
MSKHKGKFKQDEVEKISSKLKFISKIEPGQKISTNSQYIQNNTYYTSVVRYLTGESREKVYEYITDVIQDSFSVLDSLSDSSNGYDIKVCENLIGDLINLKPGLANLKRTYNNDKNYISKMETLVQNLDVKIQELCEKKNIDLVKLTKELEEQCKLEEQEKAEAQVVNESETGSGKKKELKSNEVMSGSSEEIEENNKNKSRKTEEKKSYADVAKTKNKSRRSRGQNADGDSNKNSTSNKKNYQYDVYYMSNPDDIYDYPVDLDAGIIKKHT